jgi:hypothetical protein
MNRRRFLRQSGAVLAAASIPGILRTRWPIDAPWLLVPMDDVQTEHLKAYGVAFRVLQRGGRGEWFLNYRGGSFLLPADQLTARDAALAGVRVEPLDEDRLVRIRAEIQQGNMDAIPLEKAPRVAVYVPPNAPPWDDAVTMVLQYAGIDFQKVWDAEVLGRGGLAQCDWLHLHHEDFTGQYSKFYLTYSGAAWLADMVQRNTGMAKTLGFPSVPAEKRAVAQAIAAFVERGGFLFAMCTATETLDLALASEHVDIAASFADGTPMDPDASAKMDWSKALAFQNAHLELSPTLPSFSDIDGHQVNSPLRQPLGAFKLFNFSAKIDPVATMLVQNHRDVIPDFYGLTTSFTRRTLKPGVTVLADEAGAPWVKYIHGERGQGTWTFYGGHDPEDAQHQIGDPATDLSLFPHSPGYRLILNNVLFPAAKKKELKT